MKIAFVVNTFPSLSETFILNQLTGLIDLGVDVEIFAKNRMAGQKVHGDVVKYGLEERVSYFPHNRVVRYVKAGWVFLSCLVREPGVTVRLFKFILGKSEKDLRPLFLLAMVLSKKPDAVYCHFGPNGCVAAMVKRAGLNIRVVTSFHGFDMTEYVHQKGADVYNELFEHGDLFLPISDFWKGRLIEMGCDAERIRIHRMGVELEKFPFASRTIGSGKTVKILSVGRLVEKKGHEYAIRAVAGVAEKYADVEMIIAGDGPLKDELSGLIGELGMAERIRLVGAVSQDEVARLFEQSHIFLLPSVTDAGGSMEGIPVVLMEAMSCGLAVVSTIHSGIPELVVDGKSGFLVPERDIDSLVEKLLCLIEDSGLLAEMGRYGRGIVEKDYNIERLNKQLVECLKG